MEEKNTTKKKEKRGSFIFYRSWKDGNFHLSKKNLGELYIVLVDYALDRKKPKLKDLPKCVQGAFIAIQPLIDKDYQRYENGVKGGAPLANSNAKKKQPENNQKTTDTQLQFNLETTEIQPNDNQKTTEIQPKNNRAHINTNINNNIDNLNCNLLVSSKENIFNNYDACAHARVSEKSETERKPFKDLYSEVFEYGLTDNFLKPANEVIDTMIEAFNQATTPAGLKFNQKTYSASKLIDEFIGIDADSFRSIVTQLRFNEEIDNRALYILGCIVKASKPANNNSPDKVEKFKKNLLGEIK